MSLWLLLARVVVLWFAVSIGGGLLVLGVLEFRYHRPQRRDLAEMRAHNRAVKVTGTVGGQR